DGNIDWVRDTRGRCVAQFIVRPGGEPCVWWCRCACPKSEPTPEGPAAPIGDEAVREEPAGAAGASPGIRRRQGSPDSAGAQYALF
ncbi:DUF6248 family natural product biosynthesis protein, partial [Streptomyces sp. NPDC058394]